MALTIELVRAGVDAGKSNATLYINAEQAFSVLLAADLGTVQAEGGYWALGTEVRRVYKGIERTRFFGGAMDAVRFFNAPRSQADIAATRYTMVSAANEPSLVASWRFSEGAAAVGAAVLDDVSGRVALLGDGAIGEQPSWLRSPFPLAGSVVVAEAVEGLAVAVTLPLLFPASGGTDLAAATAQAAEFTITVSAVPTVGLLRQPGGGDVIAVAGTEVTGSLVSATSALPAFFAVSVALVYEAAVGVTDVSAPIGTLRYTASDSAGALVTAEAGEVVLWVMPNTVPTVGRAFALHFDGSETYADLAHVVMPNSFTVEFWVKPDDVRDGMCMVCKHTGSGSNIVLIGYFNDGMYVNLRGKTFAAGTKIATLHHVAVAFAEDAGGASTTVTVYRDGDVLWSTVLASVADDVVTSRPWVLGMEWDRDEPSDHFVGVIDEIRMWDYARSQAQVQADRMATLAGDEAGLLGYWRLDDGGLDPVDVDGSFRDPIREIRGRYAGDSVLHGPPTWVESPVAALAGSDLSLFTPRSDPLVIALAAVDLDNLSGRQPTAPNVVITSLPTSGTLRAFVSADDETAGAEYLATSLPIELSAGEDRVWLVPNVADDASEVSFDYRARDHLSQSTTDATVRVMLQDLGPRITSFVIKGHAAVAGPVPLRVGDEMVVSFGDDTNEPPVAEPDEVDAIIAFSPPAGLSLRGIWLAPNELVLTVSPPLWLHNSTLVVGTTTVTVRVPAPGSGPGLRNAAGTSVDSDATSPPLVGLPDPGTGGDSSDGVNAGVVVGPILGVLVLALCAFVCKWDVFVYMVFGVWGELALELCSRLGLIAVACSFLGVVQTFIADIVARFGCWRRLLRRRTGSLTSTSCRLRSCWARDPSERLALLSSILLCSRPGHPFRSCAAALWFVGVCLTRRFLPCNCYCPHDAAWRRACVRAFPWRMISGMERNLPWSTGGDQDVASGILGCRQGRPEQGKKAEDEKHGLQAGAADSVAWLFHRSLVGFARSC